MRIVVIGAVAAGTSAAAKARRNDDQAEIVIYERDQDISYSGCGLPYYIGNHIRDISELTPRDSAFFKKRYNIDVKIKHEVISINKELQTIKVLNLETDEVFEDDYDKLVIATGATSFVPAIEGGDQSHVFTLRNVQDAIKIKTYLKEKKPKKAMVVGTGFIGFEVLENLFDWELDVTVVEIADKIAPSLDGDMAKYLERQLIEQGIRILKSKGLKRISEQGVELTDGSTQKADMIILATGVKPNVTLARSIGLEIGVTGAIKVNNHMETSDTNIYACGDCIETYSTITGKPVYRPLGSTANKTGRIAGNAIAGGTMAYKGNLNTSIVRLFDYTIASTGLSEKEALEEGFDIEIIHNIKPDKPSYFQGENMVIKAIADKKSGRLLGIQIVGSQGVDKRIDVFVTLITYKATVDELFHLDLAYAPPFSTTKDPVHYTGMILDNAINSNRKMITSETLNQIDEDVQIVDARTTKDYEQKGCVTGAVNMPHASIREQMKNLDSNKKTLTYCNKGTTGNAAQNILINHGFTDVANLSGGHTFYKATK